MDIAHIAGKNLIGVKKMKIRICDVCGKEIEDGMTYSHFKTKKREYIYDDGYCDITYKYDICVKCMDKLIDLVQDDKT